MKHHISLPSKLAAAALALVVSAGVVKAGGYDRHYSYDRCERPYYPRYVERSYCAPAPPPVVCYPRHHYYRPSPRVVYPAYGYGSGYGYRYNRPRVGLSFNFYR